ncbi:MAG: hypothetical protein AAB353_12430 [Candidatus Hydrogenedentota bacterium]
MSELNLLQPDERIATDDPAEAALLLGALLDEHAERAAERVLARLGGPLTEQNLSQFLEDEACLRYPARIVFDAEGLEAHQFGEPRLIDRDGNKTCEFRIHPRFALTPRLLPHFVAYLAPLVNYGPIVSSEMCEWYGALITATDPDEYYELLCRAVDSVGTS